METALHLLYVLEHFLEKIGSETLRCIECTRQSLKIVIALGLIDTKSQISILGKV